MSTANRQLNKQQKPFGVTALDPYPDDDRYPGCRVVTVELPLKPLAGEAEFAPGMIGRVVHLRLDEYQRTALYKMRQAMNDAHLRLKSGAHVDQYADVVKWILEQAT